MTTALIIKDTHPEKDFTTITQIGLKALNLATTYKADIDPRLPGTIDSLTNDLDALGAVVPGTLQARHESRAATATQNTLARQGFKRVQAIRRTVRKSGAPKDVQRAYGIGQITNPNQISHVISALQQIVDRALAAPQEAAGFGLIPADVTALADFIQSLSDADKTQEELRASAPLSTKERNLIANRVLKTAALIAGTGMRAFADSPLEHANFQALMESTTKVSPKTKTKPKANAKPKKDAAPPPYSLSSSSPTSSGAPSSRSQLP